MTGFDVIRYGYHDFIQLHIIMYRVEVHQTLISQSAPQTSDIGPQMTQTISDAARAQEWLFSSVAGAGNCLNGLASAPAW